MTLRADGEITVTTASLINGWLAEDLPH